MSSIQDYAIYYQLHRLISKIPSYGNDSFPKELIWINNIPYLLVLAISAYKISHIGSSITLDVVQKV